MQPLSQTSSDYTRAAAMRPRSAPGLRGPVRSLGDIIKLGYFQQIRLLVSNGIDAECRDSYRRTPLILCAFMEPETWAVSTAMTLIEHGVNVGARDCFGRNALHYASIYERARLVKVLLGAIDFDLEQADTIGNTALHYAAMSGNVTICQLLVRCFNKYHMSACKVNRLGRSALEEATMAGNTSCSRAIQFELTSGDNQSLLKDFRFADDIGLRSSSACLHSQNGSAATNSKRTSRPVSAAVLNRGQSSGTVTRSGGSPVPLRIRSNSGVQRTGHRRNSHNPLYANGYRRNDDIIYCAPEDDFRNKIDYVCKLVNLPFDPQIWDHMTMLSSANQSSRNYWSNTNTSGGQTPKKSMDWRLELEELFKVYEHQCSPSWRAVRKCEKPIQTSTPSPGPEEDDKGKKGRSLNNVSRSTSAKENSPELKKRVPSVRHRKITNGKLPGGTSIDGSLDTSTESINSGISSKKRGQEKEVIAGRPDSSTSKPRPRSSRETASLLQPPPTSIPSPSLKPESTPTDLSQTENSISRMTNVKGMSASIQSDINQGKTTPTILTTSPVSVNVLVAPVSSTQLTVPATDVPSSTGNKHKENTTSCPVSSVNAVPKITVLADTLGIRDSADDQQQPQVDTSKLWVQNPYEGSNDDVDDEEDDGGENYDDSADDDNSSG